MQHKIKMLAATLCGAALAGFMINGNSLAKAGFTATYGRAK